MHVTEAIIMNVFACVVHLFEVYVLMAQALFIVEMFLHIVRMVKLWVVLSVCMLMELMEGWIFVMFVNAMSLP